jgi:hypothetical protein
LSGIEFDMCGHYDLLELFAPTVHAVSGVEEDLLPMA